MLPDHNRPPHFLYITGADGTGKSTQAELLAQYLVNNGIRCRRLWLRFPFFLSLPLLAYAHWRGYSWHEVHGEINHGYWDFSRSWVMRTLFPWVLWGDAALAAVRKVFIPLFLGETIVCERFVLDMLVDLSIAIRDPSLVDRLPGKLFLNLLPGDIRIVILDLDQETICKRRQNLVLDQALASRLEAYRNVAQKLELPILDSHPSIQVVFHRIRAIMDIS